MHVTLTVHKHCLCVLMLTNWRELYCIWTNFSLNHWKWTYMTGLLLLIAFACAFFLFFFFFLSVFLSFLFNSAFLHSRADSLRSQVILHEWLAFCYFLLLRYFCCRQNERVGLHQRPRWLLDRDPEPNEHEEPIVIPRACCCIFRENIYIQFAPQALSLIWPRKSKSSVLWWWWPRCNWHPL